MDDRAGIGADRIISEWNPVGTALRHIGSQVMSFFYRPSLEDDFRVNRLSGWTSRTPRSRIITITQPIYQERWEIEEVPATIADASFNRFNNATIGTNFTLANPIECSSIGIDRP